MSQYIFPTTRWAIYFRDDLSCVYCGITMQELLEERDGNFLTLDHVKHRSKGGGHEGSNLVTACFSCNVWRGTKSTAAFARDLGLKPSALQSRIRRRTSRDLERFRPMAKLALGKIPGFPGAPLVLDHDFLVRGQWELESFDIQHWEHLRAEEGLFCPHCLAPRDHSTRAQHGDHCPAGDDDDIPF
jgi:hypothetical protein